MSNEVKEIFYELISDKATFFSFVIFSSIVFCMLFFGSLIQYVFFL